MNKKILIGLMFLMLIPITNAFANENISIIKGMKSIVYDSNTHEQYNEYDAEGFLTDDELKSTWINMQNKYVYYKFPNSFDVDSLFLKVLTNADSFTISFYSDYDHSNLITTYTPPRGTSTSHTKDLDIKNVKSIKLEGGPKASNVDLLSVFGTPNFSYDSISNLKETHDYNSINLSWENPVEAIGSIVKKDGKEIANLNKGVKSYSVKGLDEDTVYDFEVIAKYSDGGASGPVTITVKTDIAPPLSDVTKVKVKADHDRVDLSWNLPESPTFKHVNIYRDIIKEEPSLFKEVFGSVAFAAETKIFETNGTYFNDLTVQPETTYEYTLKTTDGAKESDGVTVQATTPAVPSQPPPEMEGVEGEKQENGDYLFTWQQPTEGKVKIIVGGKEYSVVSAGDKSFLIPAADMKYNFLGEPDVALQAISKDGIEGPVIDSESGKSLELPFDVKDLITSGNALLWYVGPFVLLALAFLLFPKLRNLIFGSLKGKKEERSSRRTDSVERQELKNKERHEGKEHLVKVDRIERKERMPRSKEVRTARETRQKAERSVRTPRQERQVRERTQRQQRQPRPQREKRGS